MLLSEKERPAAIQIFGSDPATMAEAAVKAKSFTCDVIDINMGCPAPKIVNSGNGSALMKNPELAQRITEECVKAVTLPVTVKMRSGWDFENIHAVELAKRCEAAGASAVTVHGRTRAQMYAPPVNIEIIKKVKDSVKIPVIGNGDVDGALSAKAMFENTGCDLVMVGRGALGRPWVFAQISAYMEGRSFAEPDIRTKMDIMLAHASKICEYKGERIGINETRKHAIWYTKGLRGKAELRRRMAEITALSQLETIAREIAEMNR